MAYQGWSLKAIANKFREGIYTAVDLQGSQGNLANPLLDLPLNNSLAMKQGVGSVTFTRASTATYVDRYGVLQYADIDEPRFEKDGLLMEGDSTNYCTNSNELFNGNVIGDLTAIEDTTIKALDGVSNTTKIVFGPSVTSGNKIDVSLGAIAGDLVGSLWIKSSANSTVHCSIKLRGLYSITATDTWTLVSSNTELHTDSPRYLGVAASADTNPNDTIYVCFMQLEELPFASSYIPTTTTAVTRSAEDCSVVYDGNIPYITDDCTIVADVKAKSLDSLGLIVATTDAYRFLTINDSGSISGATSNGATGVIYDSPKIDTDYRFVYAYNKRQMFLYVDGVLVDTDLSPTDPVSLPDKIGIGSGQPNSELNGHIKNIKIYDKTLTAEEARLA